MAWSTFHFSRRLRTSFRVRLDRDRLPWREPVEGLQGGLAAFVLTSSWRLSSSTSSWPLRLCVSLPCTSPPFKTKSYTIIIVCQKNFLLDNKKISSGASTVTCPEDEYVGAPMRDHRHGRRITKADCATPDGMRCGALRFPTLPWHADVECHLMTLNGQLRLHSSVPTPTRPVDRTYRKH